MRATTLLAMRVTRRLRMPQDMPPAAGYEPVQYKRNLPAKGFRPVWYFVGMVGVCVFGFYKAFVGIREWNELGREKIWARIHLTPLLQAELDRDLVRKYWADQQREQELLGTQTRAYNSDRFIQPTFIMTPPLDQAISKRKDGKD